MKPAVAYVRVSSKSQKVKIELEKVWNIPYKFNKKRQKEKGKERKKRR